jgi:hypothetical protein
VLGDLVRVLTLTALGLTALAAVGIILLDVMLQNSGFYDYVGDPDPDNSHITVPSWIGLAGAGAAIYGVVKRRPYAARFGAIVQAPAAAVLTVVFARESDPSYELVAAVGAVVVLDIAIVVLAGRLRPRG